MKQANTAKRKTTRHFLFLQGPKSSFFPQLAKHLRTQNFKVTKINFNAGDQLFWRGDAIYYTYPMSNWAGYISDICKIRGVTDLIVFDDKNQIHSQAISALKKQGISIYVFANGYFDTNHITLEIGGTNANSPMPREPMHYMRTPTIHMENEPEKVRSHCIGKMISEIAYISATKNGDVLNVISPLKFAQNLLNASYINLLKNKRYFVANFSADEAYMADEIIASFAKNTVDSLLIINCPAKISSSQERVLCLQNANLPRLIRNAEGLIVCGSIDGLSAIEQQKPLVALQDAIFNFAGLTNQAKLSGFWHRRIAANPSLYGKFKNHISAKTQINGGFFGAKPIKLAAENSCKTIISSGNFAFGNNVSENV
jgi:capsular polysaccharide export protein